MIRRGLFRRWLAWMVFRTNSMIAVDMPNAKLWRRLYTLMRNE